jgi:outer membrane lipopolysaccharide assembly protein LptE/RlpB
MLTGKFRTRVMLLSLIVSTAGCGYRLAGDRIDSGEGRTLAVPVFRSLTTDFKIEQQLTDAVRRELIRRTRYRVTPAGGGDVILTGEVLAVTSIPILFTDQGRGTAYTVAVAVSVRVTDTVDGRILFQNDRWTFSEVFEVSNNSVEFVPEDSAAIDRLAGQFASSLVASLNYLNPNP